MSAPSAAPEFQRVQYQFAAHLRDPARNPAPAGLEDRRLKIYRELFYNNVEDFLATAFPVLRRISADELWHRRVRAFYAGHVCHEPQFYKLAEQFLDWLNSDAALHADDPPFLRELAHYEWVELALGVSELRLTPELADPNGDLLSGRPLVSPLAQVLGYAYPVHRIGPEYLPDAPPAQPTYLIVNRDRHEEVKFTEINLLTARLLECLETDSQASGQELLTRIAGELQHPQPEQVVRLGGEMLVHLRGRDIILGTRR